MVVDALLVGRHVHLLDHARQPPRRHVLCDMCAAADTERARLWLARVV